MAGGDGRLQDGEQLVAHLTDPRGLSMNLVKCMDDTSVDPVTLEPFRTPVVASDGHTYELSSLREWV
jgi:hypothetical protein